ncbi:MAG: hypothetical protein Fur0023_10760 [Bacteroidia bacterium]
MKLIKTIINGLILLGVFTMCKKYDENILLFSAPEQTLEKLSRGGGHFVYCKINGVDSTELMKNIIPEYTRGQFIYSPNSITGSEMGKSDFFNANIDDGNGHYHFFIAKFISHKKIFSINRQIRRFIPTFKEDRNQYDFKVIRLTPHEFKIRINSNDKEYEILIAK